MPGIDRRQRSIVATCVALVLAAVGDAGPEIIESRSLVADYDGPGPLIYLVFAAVVGTFRWRYVPLLAVLMSALFLVGGFADSDFTRRLTMPTETAGFVGAWLQTIGFVAAIGFGIAAVRRRAPAGLGASGRQ